MPGFAADNDRAAAASLTGRLLAHASVRPEQQAVVTPDFSISYADLAKLVVAQAERLAAVGVGADVAVGICCDDDVQHLLLCLAASYCGATSCTIPSHESDQLQAALAERVGAQLVLGSSFVVELSSGPALATAALPPAPQSGIVFSTSGTTGTPKLVLHHDSDLVAQAHRHVNSPEERFACLASMEHNFAKRHRLYCVAVGGTNVFPGKEYESLVERCLSLQVNVLHVSAFQAQELLALSDVARLSGLRLKLGGSHVAPSLRQQLRKAITPHLQAGYGTTETGAIAFTDPEDAEAAESVGRALPGIDIRAVNAEREPLPPGERGELAVRCEGMFRGYLNQPELTASRLDQGWFYTGDTGFLDAQGRIHICGRLDDMFVFNSMNIYPQDIESVIREYPQVRDVVVLPRKSSVHGNIPVALVVLAGKPNKHLPALKKFVDKRVGIRAPRQYLVVDEIPTNASGKIARRDAMDIPEKNDQLRQNLVAMLEQKVKQRVKPALLQKFIRGETDIALRHFAMDSLERLELLLALETGYNIVVHPAQFNGFRYLGDLVAHLLSRRDGESDGEAAAETVELIERDIAPKELAPKELAPAGAQAPQIVRLFQRVYRVSRAVVQLSKALTTLENRLTPIEAVQLYQWHARRLLLPADTPEQRRAMVSRWLSGLCDLMEHSGKRAPEPYRAHRLAPTARLFSGPGSPQRKALLVCFPPSGGRNMMMPNTVFLQHASAAQVDVLMLSEALNQKYRSGIPFVGRKLDDMVGWLKRHERLAGYRRFLSMGCSAGAPLALAVGGRLNAEVALSVCGRFYRRRHLVANMGRLLSIYRAQRRADGVRMIYAYGVDDSRDQTFAAFMARYVSGEALPIAFADSPVGHEILRQLLDRAELGDFLAATIFSESVAGLANKSNTPAQTVTAPDGCAVDKRRAS